MSKPIQIEKSWFSVLKDEFSKDYFVSLRDFVYREYKESIICPSPKNIFKAFDMCPFDKVKVVLVGQDPYHGKDQATGLSFSVQEQTLLPPSLKNIFKEIHDDVGIKTFAHGDLSRWAEQGVLLLNATLTVSLNAPGSHQKRGWEEFTDSVIEALNNKRENLVFILWGNYAKNKGKSIDRTKHCVIESPHPSPFSAHNGFFGSKPFSKTNEYLKSKGIGEIDWS